MGCTGYVAEPSTDAPAPGGGFGSAAPTAEAGGSAATTPSAPPQVEPPPGVTPSVGIDPPRADEPDPKTCPSPTRRRVRRITQREYTRIVTDLTGTPPAVLAWSSPDVLVNGFDTNAEALTVSTGNFDDFALAAEMVANSLDVARLAPCETEPSAETCVNAFVKSFASRAYGREPSVAETNRLLSIHALGSSSGGYARGIQLVAEAVLLSPHFLYRTELGMGAGAGPSGTEAALTPDEAANALAFALTGSRPDDALRRRAASDPAFLTPVALRQEADRLISTPRARDRLAEFLRSWLGVRDLQGLQKQPHFFPAFSPQMKAELDEEIARFIHFSLTDGGGTLVALLGGRVGFPSTSLFQTYYAGDYVGQEQLPELPAPGTWIPVPFNPARRRGILSLAGWLAAHASVHRSSPVHRGLTIRSRLFCQGLPSPPGDALANVPGAGDATFTTRQKFEQHVVDPKCKGCHELMDPIGFGLEMMDTLGRYRETENGLPVDSHGYLTGTDVDGPFVGPAELSDRLLASRAVRECFTLQMFRFLEGRDWNEADRCHISEVQRTFALSDAKISDIAVALSLRDAAFRRSFEP